MKFTWGRYPPYAVAVLVLIGCGIILFGSNFLLRIITLGIILGLTLLNFMHFVIETDRYFIFCYSLIFVIIKHEDGALIKHNYRAKFCENVTYFVGRHRPKKLFLYGEHDKQEYLKAKKAKKQQKAETQQENQQENKEENKESPKKPTDPTAGE